VKTLIQSNLDFKRSKEPEKNRLKSRFYQDSRKIEVNSEGWLIVGTGEKSRKIEVRLYNNFSLILFVRKKI
jgi:hypothetical protein